MIYLVFFFFSMGWGPVVWTVCTEIVPGPLRAKANSCTTATNWLTATLVGYAFPLLAKDHLNVAFAIFATAMLIASLVVYFFLPETSGPAEEVDRRCREFVVRRPRNESTKHAPSGPASARVMSIKEATSVPASSRAMSIRDGTSVPASAKLRGVDQVVDEAL